MLTVVRLAPLNTVSSVPVFLSVPPHTPTYNLEYFSVPAGTLKSEVYGEAPAPELSPQLMNTSPLIAPLSIVVTS